MDRGTSGRRLWGYRRHFTKPALPDGYVRDGYSESDIRAKLQDVGFMIKRITYLFGYFGSLAGDLDSTFRQIAGLNWGIFPFLLLMSKLDSILTKRDGNGMLFEAVK